MAREELSKDATQKESKSTSSSKGNDDVSPVREVIVVDEGLWNPSGSQTPDRELDTLQKLLNGADLHNMDGLSCQAFSTQNTILGNFLKDVYSKVTGSLVVSSLRSWSSWSQHLEEITVRRQDDQLYMSRCLTNDFVPNSLMICFLLLVHGTRYSLKDKNEAKPDKTKSGIEKSVKN
ncbi:hypothetical protein Tco_0374267 [Tanacetum coccineum]